MTVVPWITCEVAVESERHASIHIHTGFTLRTSRQTAGNIPDVPFLDRSSISQSQMPGPTQALSPNGENNNDIIPDNNGTNIIPYRKNTVRGERAYRYTTAITIRRPLYKETAA